MKLSFAALAAGFSALALSVSAQAKELTFFFDVHSSGPEIYPCDAGHWQGDNGQYCHYKGTAAACSPDQFGKTIGEISPGQDIKDYLGAPIDPVSKVHACICTGKNGGGYLMNFMRYKAAKWVGGTTGGDNHMGWSTATSGVANQPSAGAGTTVASKVWGTTDAKNVPQEFKTQLEAVTFNFGSELYGANYFVDFCYRGPQLPYYTDGNGLDAPAYFSSLAHVTKTNPFGTGDGTKTLDYTQLSKVGMQWELVCDHQGDGTYKYDHSGVSLDGGTGKFNDLDKMDIADQNTPPNFLGASYIIPGADVANWVGKLSGDSALSGTVANSKLVTGDLSEMYGVSSQQWITYNSPKVPRFCKLRTYFAEDSTKNRERAWQRADARYIVKWSVEEDAPTE